MKTEYRYRVVGDHPVAARPDKVWRGVYAELQAELHANMLKSAGYENVAIIKEVETV